MGKIALVFSGQGAQYPGMGKEICECSKAAEEVFRLAESIRPGTKEQCFSGTKEDLSKTINTQPCLFTVDLAIGEALREAGIPVSAVAGFSLGELPALVFSGVLSPEEGFQAVCKRGEFMSEASEKNPGGMVAVMKLAAGQVDELCAARDNVYPVNYNSPAQTVVAYSGDISEFKDAVKGAKGMAMSLAVSGAFHSPLMAEASDRLKTVLEELAFQNPQIPVYANATAKAYPNGAEEIRELMAQQVKSPVRWQETVENMISDGFDTFIEAGPGKTLTGLIRKIATESICYNVEKKEDLEALIAQLKTTNV